MKLCKDFVLRNICGDFLLVPLGEKSKEYSGVFALTETGAFIIQNLSESKDVRELAELLAQEFDIDCDSAREDVAAFTDNLMSLGILTE